MLEGFDKEWNYVTAANRSAYYTNMESIGLYLTKTLVELHKGTITVHSIPKEWTEFRVRLPIDAESYQIEIEKSSSRDNQMILSEASEEEAVVATPLQAAKTERSPYTLLIIEDDKELLSSISNLLADDFHLLTATDGQKGFQIALEKNPDLIITDVMLPGINGFDLCRLLKEELAVSHIPILLLTAKTTPQDKVFGYQMGADAYITKPFQFDILYAQIVALLKNREKILKKFRHDELLPGSTEAGSSPDQRFLEQAVAIIEQHLADTEFDIQAFHTAMQISNSMLYRKVKALTALSPNEFIRNIRLKKACALLIEGSYNISEIAYMVGFNDAKYFSNCFKKEFKRTPTEYMEEFKQGNSAVP